jgi:hypothetical protein
MPWQVLPTQTDIIAIHAALLPTSPEGDILCFGDWTGHGPTSRPFTHCRLYHMASQSLESFATGDMPNTNAFCAGQAFLADGRLLVAGGTIGWPEEHAGLHDPHWDGERACWLYLPRAKRWTRIRDLNFQPGSNSQGGGRWYPTLVTLANGEIFAAAGHPSDTDDYPPNVPLGQKRHNNNTPERYASTTNTWTLMTANITAPNNLDTDAYPRFHLLPNGLLFSDTAGNLGTKRLYNPFAGTWTGPDVAVSVLPSYYNRGSSSTSVLLPLLPPYYKPRVLVCNSPHNTAFRIDIDTSPQWVVTSNRQGSATGKERAHACAVLLPTGQVFLTGGSTPGNAGLRDPVLVPEIYTPGINWATGDFTALESWDTIQEPANVPRGYHTVALLLPDGRVWTAGSTKLNDDSNQFAVAEKRVDIFSPSYVGTQRPQIQSAPTALTYGQSFTITVDGDIQRVALMRCGSTTHAYDSDQRYVGLVFTQQGNQLKVISPPNAWIAPPGYYMLWVIDAANRPCTQAKFVRLSHQSAFLITDRSTFSMHEIDAVGLPATFSNAFYFVLDGFLPHEVGQPIQTPQIEFRYPGGQAVPGLTAVLVSTRWEDPATPPDIAQRVTFVFHIRFTNRQAFNQITGQSDDIILRGTHGAFRAQATLVLSKDPNPYMRDGEIQWLSTDLRVFQLQPGMTRYGVTHGSGPNAPINFIQTLLQQFNAHPPDEDHPFLQIPTDPQASRLSLATQAANRQAVYNFAVAKVRMKAPVSVYAEDVRVFFRLFTTAVTTFEYNPNTYARSGTGANAVPVLGVVNGDIATIPFFAEARIANPHMQPDNTNQKTIQGQGMQEVHTYFGCWLDFNQTPPRYQEDGVMKSIQEIIRGNHQCLVAEIDYAVDPIPPNATPGSNENLAQRNLVIEEAPNPASVATRTITHTLEIAPSKTSAQQPSSAAFPVQDENRAPYVTDELIFIWQDLPSDTQVTLYLPDVDVNHVLTLASQRQGPPVLGRVDEHTLRLLVGNITYVPVPSGRLNHIPALCTFQLPPDLVRGTVYHVIVQQMEGHTRRIIGSVQITIPITTTEEILPEEIRKLAVFRHIALKLATTNKWYPIFERYLGYIADRVRALGGNPDTILPSPTGNPYGDEQPTGKRNQFTGKVSSILYDCYGDFAGFVIDTCDGRQVFPSCERAVEEIIRRACNERAKVTVLTDDNEDRRLLQLVMHCCGSGSTSLS